MFVAAMLASATCVWRRTSDLFPCPLTYGQLVGKQYGQNSGGGGDVLLNVLRCQLTY